LKTTNPARRVIALGFFDGVHLGHGALLRRVGAVARERGAIPAAVTFDTHPEKLILRTPVPLISSPEDRAELMRRCYGIRDVIVARFDERMMRMSWQDFITEYLVEGLGAVHLVAGHDFHFGYKGEGNRSGCVRSAQPWGWGAISFQRWCRTISRSRLPISAT